MKACLKSNLAQGG